MSEKTIGFALLLFALNAAGCHSVKTLSEGNPDSVSPPGYSVLIYIHGDGDYLYHDPEGRAVQADDNALDKAMDLAKRAEQGEVFIFHHRAQKKIAGLFPRNTNRVYHYQGGNLLHELSYRAESAEEKFLQTEAELFKRYRSDKSTGHRHFFLYFGHEIPESPGHAYHRSRPGTEVVTGTFISGAKGFLNDNDRFDMLALSTCNNGTPSMLAGMKDAADVVLASPQNLHLSHIDIRSLSLLESDQKTPSNELAKTIAEDTFHRLANSVQTAVTLSVYDIRQLDPYIGELNERYTSCLNQHHPNLSRENTDCRPNRFFEFPAYTVGVHSFFKPASFGASAQQEEYSGWGCKPL